MGLGPFMPFSGLWDWGSKRPPRWTEAHRPNPFVGLRPSAVGFVGLGLTARVFVGLGLIVRGTRTHASRDADSHLASASRHGARLGTYCLWPPGGSVAILVRMAVALIPCPFQHGVRLGDI